MIYCNKSNQIIYPFSLQELPFDKDSFTPYFSSETFDYHHGKHHLAYITNLNNLIKDTDLSENTLEEIITKSFNSNTAIFNNAAQVWNHNFFWHSIKPNGGGIPSAKILKKIETDFGSFQEFMNQFQQTAVSQFGSGWAWLVYKNKKLEIMKTSNAETPIAQGIYPLLACDVWEHAYYIDYRNKRPDYVSTYINHMINWDFVEMRMTVVSNNS